MTSRLMTEALASSPRWTIVVETELSRCGEAKLKVELDVEVGAIGE